MAKKRSGKEINGRQILCGMEIKLPPLNCRGICLITQRGFLKHGAGCGKHRSPATSSCCRHYNAMPLPTWALEIIGGAEERFQYLLTRLRSSAISAYVFRVCVMSRRSDELDVAGMVKII